MAADYTGLIITLIFLTAGAAMFIFRDRIKMWLDTLRTPDIGGLPDIEAGGPGEIEGFMPPGEDLGGALGEGEGGGGLGLPPQLISLSGEDEDPRPGENVTVKSIVNCAKKCDECDD